MIFTPISISQLYCTGIIGILYSHYWNIVFILLYPTVHELESLAHSYRISMAGNTSTKVTSLAAILGGNSTRTGRDPGRLNLSNRFEILRDRSSSINERPPRSPSTKRPLDDNYIPDGKVPRTGTNPIFAAMVSVEVKIEKMKDTFCKTKALLEKAALTSPMGELLGGIMDSLEAIIDTQETLSSALVDSGKSAGGKTNSSDSTQVSQGNTKAAMPPPPAPTAGELKRKKFVMAMRDAEKSLLMFGLNLGTVPIMNTTTLSQKVTTDITSKAAFAEDKTNGRPSDDTVTILEDTLSLAKGLEFFGKVTKPYVNSRDKDDPANNTFHTLPVRMSFKDKDAKIRAEKVLRSSCKISCTTPYPPNLRAAISKVMSAQKAAHKEDFVQVRVDLEKFTLNVSRKIDGTWRNNIETVPINDDAMDLSRPGRKVSDSTISDMEVQQSL